MKFCPKTRWIEIAPVIEREFNAVLPNSGKATIVADFGTCGEINGFVICEHLLRIGQIWTNNEREDGQPRPMINYLIKNMPVDTSVIVIASDARFEGTAE